MRRCCIDEVTRGGNGIYNCRSALYDVVISAQHNHLLGGLVAFFVALLTGVSVSAQRKALGCSLRIDGAESVKDHLGLGHTARSGAAGTADVLGIQVLRTHANARDTVDIQASRSRDGGHGLGLSAGGDCLKGGEQLLCNRTDGLGCDQLEAILAVDKRDEDRVGVRGQRVVGSDDHASADSRQVIGQNSGVARSAELCRIIVSGD